MNLPVSHTVSKRRLIADWEFGMSNAFSRRSEKSRDLLRLLRDAGWHRMQAAVIQDLVHMLQQIFVGHFAAEVDAVVDTDLSDGELPPLSLQDDAIRCRL